MTAELSEDDAAWAAAHMRLHEAQLEINDETRGAVISLSKRLDLIESRLTGSEQHEDLAEAHRDHIESIHGVQQYLPDMTLFAQGGLESEIDLWPLVVDLVMNIHRLASAVEFILGEESGNEWLGTWTPAAPS